MGSNIINSASSDPVADVSKIVFLLQVKFSGSLNGCDPDTNTLHDCCWYCRVRIPKQSGECNNNSPEFKGINRRTFLKGSGLLCFCCMFVLPLHSCCTYIARFARKLHDYCTIPEIANKAIFEIKSKKYLDSYHIVDASKMVMATPIKRSWMLRLNYRSAE